VPATETRLRPRKTPRQARAHDTRARILAAASDVFSERGYAAGTTNRIAAAAGMSVGSLYQYFPNKDAILVELVHAHIAEGERRLAPVLQRAAATNITIEPLIRAVVTELVALHSENRRLHRVLFEESPRPASLLRELHAAETRIVELATSFVLAANVRTSDPALTARISVTTIESLVHRMIATDTPIDTEAFSDEVVRLVSGYLTGTTARA
jgi:AcrR family transcriptional regulator